MKKRLLLIMAALLLGVMLALTACGGGGNGTGGGSQGGGSQGGGILKTEIIDGYLWITYTNDPQNPVNVGKVYGEEVTEGTEGLEYYPLPDGTYGVMAGTTMYLEDIVIPETYKGKSITQILPNAFEKSINLKNITIPDSVTSIGNSAFAGCTSLKSIKYRGTEDEWNAISKGGGWNYNTGNYTITYNYDGE